MKKQLVISTSVDLVRIAPDRIVYIDGHRGIIEYDKEVIKLSAKGGKIILKGKDMYIASFSKDFMKQVYHTPSVNASPTK